MSAAVSTAAPVARRRSQSSPWRDAWRRYRRNRMALIGSVIAGFVLLVAILAPMIAPYSYSFSDISATLQPPSAQHLLGTDAIGRDFLSRLVYGARTSMIIGFLVPLIGSLLGIPLGAIAGWFGGRVDFVFLRLIEAMTALPSILLALLLVTIYGSGLYHVALFLGITGWVPIARLTRAQFLALRDREFVVAARAIGTPPWRIMLAHLLPNAAGPMIILFVLGIPTSVFGAAGLSFLGLGVQDPIPSWGKMIADSGQYVQIDPLLGMLPIACIAITVLGFSFVADGLRDALDPHALD